MTNTTFEPSGSTPWGELWSPPLDFTSIHKPFITFQMWSYLKGQDFGGVQLQASINGGKDWVLVGQPS
jgi:hypothetical protein